MTCLQSILENKRPLQTVAISEEAEETFGKMPEVKTLILDEKFWNQAKEYHVLLTPVAKAISKVEGDEPKICELVQIFNDLESFLILHLPQIMVQSGEETIFFSLIQSRKDFCLYDIHRVAHLLDPRTTAGACLLNPEKMEKKKY